jgi:hypothetical protein
LNIRGVDGEQKLDVIVDRRLAAYQHAIVYVLGVADSSLGLWAYADPRGRECSATPEERPPKTQALITALPVEGGFGETRRPKVKPGRTAFCAYLGPDESTAHNTSFRYRTVPAPLLRAQRANETPARALGRHQFAARVIENLEQHCRRRSRSRFSCRFSSAFPGYSLSGRGFVERKEDLTYRFRVRAQGRKLTLTDENEGRLPG